MDYLYKISVIVPVYNAGKYLHRCLDSLVNQTFSGYEIVLVNDGSTDDSGKICDAYAAQYPNITVFNKENGGVSSARQCGLDNSRGEYLLYVDSDDWIELDMLADMYNSAVETNSDIVYCDFYREFKNETRYAYQGVDGSYLLELFNHTRDGVLWNKLIRRECFTSNNIAFDNKINLWEDLYICCRILLKGATVKYLNKAYYHYDCYSNPNSILRNESIKDIYSLMNFVSYFEGILDDKDLLRVSKATIKDKVFKKRYMPIFKWIMLYKEINVWYIETYKGDTKNPITLAMIGMIKLYRFLFDRSLN